MDSCRNKNSTSLNYGIKSTKEMSILWLLGFIAGLLTNNVLAIYGSAILGTITFIALLFLLKRAKTLNNNKSINDSDMNG